MTELAKAPPPRQPLPTKPLAPPQAAKRNWLAEITTATKKRPLSIVLAGQPGVGKTSMAANAPSPIFLCDAAEDGISTLKQYGLAPDVPQLPPCQSWPDALEMIDSLATQPHQHKTLVMDAMGGFERLMHEEVCRRDYKNEWGDKGFGSYQKGYDSSLADWRLMINALDRLRDERGMMVLLLSHVKVSTFKNPEGSDFDRYSPDVHHKTWSLTHKWAEVVLFANYVTYVDAKDLKAKGKATGGQDRVMYTEHHAAWDAKNRLGLSPEISMGTSGADAWAAFWEVAQGS